jgi:nucleoside-diphosphate-sugar epimerase
MRISVFGGQGFIGGRLVAHFHRSGHDVLVPKRAETRNGAAKGGYGVAIWAAGLTADFRERPFDTVEAHVAAMLPVLREAQFDSFLYLSSTRIYQRAQQTDESAALNVEPGDPSDLYNLSKLMGEALCLSTKDPRVRVARLSNVVGPGEWQRNTFVGDLCREAESGHVVLRTSPETVKDYIWIDDVVELLDLIAMSGTQRIYNVASGRQTSHAAWADAITLATGATFETAPDAVDGSFPAIKVERLRKEFGFSPEDPLRRITAIAAR